MDSEVHKNVFFAIKRFKMHSEYYIELDVLASEIFNDSEPFNISQDVTACKCTTPHLNIHQK